MRKRAGSTGDAAERLDEGATLPHVRHIDDDVGAVEGCREDLADRLEME